ncbi:hypothetical protein ACKWTF_009057 [Chironomus riparius]
MFITKYPYDVKMLIAFHQLFFSLPCHVNDMIPRHEEAYEKNLFQASHITFITIITAIMKKKGNNKNKNIRSKQENIEKKLLGM